MVIPAVVKFAHSILERCNLQLQWSKSSIFTWSGELPSNAPAGVQIASKIVNGCSEVGFDCYGIPIGSDNFIKSEVKSVAEKIVQNAQKTSDLLSTDRQALWTALPLSIMQRFQYICQHVQPSLCEPIAD